MTFYDFVIVGAGTGGCLAAKTAANLGLKVCLIDRKREKEIGDKVCGEAIGKGYFEELGIKAPSGPEFARIIDGADIYSPNRKTRFRIRSEELVGFVINRHEFGQRLLKEALDAGADLLDHSLVKKVIIENDFVKGVEVKSLKTENDFEVYGKITVDASGFASVLRKQLPETWGVEPFIRNEDTELGYMEIRELREQLTEPNYIRIYLSNKIAPGGYYWLFPKDGTKVNVGIGVQMTKNFPDPKRLLYEHVLTSPMFKEKLIKGGTWFIPTRRPIATMVGNGIIMIGDAACQTNPIHGGGIGPSMIAGKIAAEIGAKAIERNDVSQTALWPFNLAFIKRYGKKAAGLDVFRIFLQKCSDEELNYGMENRLITEEDLLKASVGEPLRLNITEKASRVFRGIGKLSFLRQLNFTANKMNEMRALYDNYPSPEGLAEWNAKVQRIIGEMKAMNF